MRTVVTRFQELKPTEEQRRYANENVISSAYFQRADTRDATPEEQYYAFLGEVVIADAFNNERPVLNKTADKGYDVDWFGTKIDVKTRSINVEPDEEYEEIVLAKQLENPPSDEYLLFLDYHKERGIFYVAGITSKLGFKNVARLVEAGEEKCPGFVAVEPMYFAAIKHLSVARIPE